METVIADFVKSASKETDFPNTPLREIAFIGRSNVGKSSLINSLVARKNLAHTSNTPGKTQCINFFIIHRKFMLVDMPGFGFAKVSKKERNQWQELNEAYLLRREQLALACCLVDARHDPQAIDMATIEMLENSQRKYVIILTKKDKISTKAIQEREEQLRHLTQYCSYCDDILPYSSITQDTRSNLWAIIKRHLSGEE